MKPHIAEAERAKADVVSLKEKLKALKTVDPRDRKIAELETKIGEQEKAAREAQAKANAIDAAVFDLKAVNPNAVGEVIQSIADQGELVAQTLKTLRALLEGHGARPRA